MELRQECEQTVSRLEFLCIFVRHPSIPIAFPAQRKGPGLITLTDAALYYTSLASSKPELSINLKDVLAVKKSGVTRGLKIRWVETESGEEREERFLWVGDRDNLFARLVGWNGRRWLGG